MFWDIIAIAALSSLCIFGIGFGLSRLGRDEPEKKKDAPES